MPTSVTIVWDGLEQTLNRLTEIKERAAENLQTQTEKLAKDTGGTWKQNTPRKTGRTQEEERVEAAGLTFTLNNSTYYYDWLNDGHMTPRGWHRKRGYRLAKHRSHVEGRQMTEKTLEFVVDNIEEYLSKFLDNV